MTSQAARDNGSFRPTITYVLAYPPDSRDAERYGMRYLRESGFQVRVWLVSPLVYPTLDPTTIQPPEELEVSVIRDEGQWAAGCQTLNRDDVVLLIGVPLVPSTLAQWRLFNRLLLSPARVGVVTSGDLPSSQLSLPIESRLRLTVKRLTSQKTAKEAVAQLWRVRGTLRARLLQRALQLPPLRCKEGLRFVWAATTTRSIPNRWIVEGTKVKFLHALDYDFVLSQVSTPPGSGEGMVFLDSMGPSHPDYLLQEDQTGPGSTMQEYSAAICRALDRIESTTGDRVTIAAHPRAELGSMEKWYGHRVVKYGDTPRLVANASVCIAAEGTTALGLAAVYRKPIMMLTSAMHSDMSNSLNSAFVEKLGCTVVNIDDAAFNLDILPVDEALYADYVATYVKRPDTPERLFWAEVAADILEPY